MLQSRTIQKLHRDEGLIRLLADLVNRADIRVIEGGRCARLTPEPPQRLWALREAGSSGPHGGQA
jgi:hypothetical protein